jgi:hypothetical protein
MRPSAGRAETSRHRDIFVIFAEPLTTVRVYILAAAQIDESHKHGGMGRMRRLFVAAVMTAAVLFGSACNGSDDAGSDQGSSSNGGSTASSAPPADNTAQVCANVKQMSTEYTTKIADILKKVGEDVASGDVDKMEQRMNELTALTKEWAGKLRTEAEKATNPELRKTLNDLATEVEKVDEANDANIDALTGPNSPLVKNCGAGITG